MRQPNLPSQHRPRLPPARPFRQAAILLESVPRPRRSRAAAEARTRYHLFRMAVHAAGDSAAENGGGSRQGALRRMASYSKGFFRQIAVGRHATKIDAQNVERYIAQRFWGQNAY